MAVVADYRFGSVGCSGGLLFGCWAFSHGTIGNILAGLVLNPQLLREFTICYKPRNRCTVKIDGTNGHVGGSGHFIRLAVGTALTVILAAFSRHSRGWLNLADDPLNATV